MLAQKWLKIDSRKYDDSMTLFVLNLPNKATGDSVLELFGDNAKSVRILTDRYGLVVFNSIESLDAAIGESWELNGRQLTVTKDIKSSGTFLLSWSQMELIFAKILRKF